MPLLRSRMRVHRARFRFGVAFFVAVGAWTLVFAVVLACHYLLKCGR